MDSMNSPRLPEGCTGRTLLQRPDERKSILGIDRGTAAILALTVLTAFCMKLFYSTAGPSGLRWILLPTAVFVQAFSGVGFLFDPLRGYVATDVPVIIGPGCAGVNFFVIALCMCTFSFIGRFRAGKVYAFLGFAAVTYIVTVLVNAFRIVGGLMLLEFGRRMDFAVTGVMHSAQGALFYFFFLVLYYISLQSFMNRSRRKADEAVQ